MEKRYHFLWRELRHHLPFSILSVSMGMLFAGVLTFIGMAAGTNNLSGGMQNLFHILHPTHVLISAMATTAMFRQHERRLWKAVAVGFVASVGICGISDIFFPYFSGLILGAPMHLHVCIIEHPQIILPFALLGIFTGLLAPGTIEKNEGIVFSHTLHVFISANASIAYLISYGFTNWMAQVGSVLIFMVLSVVIPCCTSDILFPLCFINRDDGGHCPTCPH